MLKIIYKAIIFSPRLLFQSLFQPSRANSFINQTKENENIYVTSFGLIGLCAGMIFDFFLPSQLFIFIDKFFVVLSFAVVGACTVAVAFAVAGAVALAGAGDCSAAVAVAAADVFVGAGSSAVADEVSFEGVVAGAGAVVVAGAVAGTVIAGFFLSIYLPPIFTTIILLLASINWILFYLEENGNIDIPFDSDSLFITGLIFFCIAGGMSLTEINNFQITILPFSYGISYFLVSQLYFIHKNNQFIKKYKTKERNTESRRCYALHFFQSTKSLS